jgi:hypothetical protein
MTEVISVVQGEVEDGAAVHHSDSVQAVSVDAEAGVGIVGEPLGEGLEMLLGSGYSGDAVDGAADILVQPLVPVPKPVENATYSDVTVETKALVPLVIVFRESTVTVRLCGPAVGPEVVVEFVKGKSSVPDSGAVALKLADAVPGPLGVVELEAGCISELDVPVSEARVEATAVIFAFIEDQVRVGVKGVDVMVDPVRSNLDDAAEPVGPFQAVELDNGEGTLLAGAAGDVLTVAGPVDSGIVAEKAVLVLLDADVVSRDRVVLAPNPEDEEEAPLPVGHADAVVFVTGNGTGDVVFADDSVVAPVPRLATGDDVSTEAMGLVELAADEVLGPGRQTDDHAEVPSVPAGLTIEVKSGRLKEGDTDDIVVAEVVSAVSVKKTTVPEMVPVGPTKLEFDRGNKGVVDGEAAVPVNGHVRPDLEAPVDSVGGELPFVCAKGAEPERGAVQENVTPVTLLKGTGGGRPLAIVCVVVAAAAAIELSSGVAEDPRAVVMVPFDAGKGAGADTPTGDTSVMVVPSGPIRVMVIEEVAAIMLQIVVLVLEAVTNVPAPEGTVFDPKESELFAAGKGAVVVEARARVEFIATVEAAVEGMTMPEGAPPVGPAVSETLDIGNDAVASTVALGVA